VPPIADEELMAAITAFAVKHPEVHLQVEFSSRLVDLQREGYDVALRASTRIEPGLVARVLARQEVIAVASPRYLAEYGTPKSLRDLRVHRCLAGFARGELPQTAWTVGTRTVQINSVFASNEPRLIAEAAVQGLGIALLPSILVREQLAAGRLVRVLPELLRTESRVAIVYAERELMAPHVRAFLDDMATWNMKFLEPPPRKKR
jgi:DNA-binding transcriptional LysR family regulator